MPFTSACVHRCVAQELRIVAVGGPGCACPCGGTHVPSTGVIQGVKVSKIKSKKGKTTVYYSVVDAA